MKAPAVQGEARKFLNLPIPLPIPEEIIENIVQNLSRTTNLLNPVYLGSRELTSAKSKRKRLRRLCRVSQRMHEIVTPYLYRTIFITDSNKLTRLYETLEKDPVLYRYLESLTVHQNTVLTRTGEERYISLSELSYMIVSILEKAPRLARLSLIPTGMEVFQDAPRPPSFPLD